MVVMNCIGMRDILMVSFKELINQKFSSNGAYSTNLHTDRQTCIHYTTQTTNTQSLWRYSQPQNEHMYVQQEVGS